MPQLVGMVLVMAGLAIASRASAPPIGAATASAR
jgi:hypothetical protein